MITYPPEMLPTPDDGDEVEVIVVDPITGIEQRVTSAPAACSNCEKPAPIRAADDPNYGLCDECCGHVVCSVPAAGTDGETHD